MKFSTLTPKNFDPPIIADISKYWRLVAQPTRPCTYLHAYLIYLTYIPNVGPIFVKGEEISVKTEEGKHFARVSRSIHNWLVGKWGLWQKFVQFPN